MALLEGRPYQIELAMSTQHCRASLEDDGYIDTYRTIEDATGVADRGRADSTVDVAARGR